MNLRQATTADVPTLAELNHRLQNRHADAFPDRFRRDVPRGEIAEAFRNMMQAPEAFWIVAEKDGRTIAFLSAEFRKRDANWVMAAHHICYLGGIVVAPEFQRKGIARKLLDELKQEAATRGATTIELDVWAFNDEAKQAFASLGFQGMMERMTLGLAEAGGG
jgi:ribosomal protein S18 acetylase RimI-like enzyme